MEAIEINDDDDATLRIMMTIILKMLKIIMILMMSVMMVVILMVMIIMIITHNVLYVPKNFSILTHWLL